MKLKLTMIAAGLLVAATANAQPVPGRTAAFTSCSAEIARERTSFDSNLKKHVADGKIDAKEKADLEKTHAELLAMETKAKADGKMTDAECKAIHTKILEENKKMAAAIGVRQVGHATRVVRHPQMVSCAAEVARERTSFDTNLKKHVADGRIDAKEKADLEKTHAELMAMEKKANEDGKMTPDECKAIHAKILEENKKMAAAIGTRAAGHATRVVRHPQVLACHGDIARERKAYLDKMTAGLASKKIDAKEKAALDKTHGELLAMEKKAAEDGKMTPDECKAIHAKVLQEMAALNKAIKS